MPTLSTPLTELLSATVRPPVGSSAAELSSLLRGLEPAPEPIPVFRSLTRVLVPRICDAATAWISVAGQPPSTVGFRVLDSSGCEPWTPCPDIAAYCSDAGGTSSSAAGGDGVLVPISPPSSQVHPSYQGVLMMTFAGLRPTLAHVLIGHLLVEHAIGLVQREQLVVKIENLQCALKTNREIGAAMGILMARHQLTADQAFDLLRRASQHCHRKVVALAAEVVQTGTLELPEGVELLERRPTPGPPRRPHRSPHLRMAR